MSKWLKDLGNMTVWVIVSVMISLTVATLVSFIYFMLVFASEIINILGDLL